MLGVLCSNVNRVAFTRIHGAGRQDLPAKLHVAQLPFYLGALWVLLGCAGIEGAAMAWTGRVILVDTLALLIIGARLVPDAATPARNALLGLAGALTAVLSGAVLDGVAPKSLYAAAMLAAFTLLCW